MISREEVSDALTFIALSDKGYAEAKTEVERFELLCRRARAFAYKATDAEDKVDERKADVELNDYVQETEDARISAFLKYETLKAERETNFLKIELFRTFEATRRRETI